MISAVSWIPRGIPLEYPVLEDLDEEDFGKITQDKKEKKTSSKDTSQEHLDPISEKYNLENYDDDDLFGLPPGVISDRKHFSSAQVHESPDTSEIEETRIYPTENLVLLAKTSEDFPSIEVYVREQSGNVYIHNSVFLPEMPLCIEWIGNGNLGCIGKSLRPTRNYVGIGMLIPEIEIWNLDFVNPLYPSIILGSKKKDKLSSKADPTRVSKSRHTGAVTCLSWNKMNESILASGSVDKTLKIWDISAKETAISSHNQHTNNVEDVCWHHSESTVILSGGQDGKCLLMDIRSIDRALDINVGSGVECIKWDPHNEWNFYASTSNGMIFTYDSRHDKKPLVKLNAHDRPVTSLDVSPFVKGLVVSSSTDRSIKVWNFSDYKPKCAFSRKPGIGKIFSTAFSPDSQAIVLAGGNKGNFIIWNLENSSEFAKCFPNAKVTDEVAESSGSDIFKLKGFKLPKDATSCKSSVNG